MRHALLNPKIHLCLLVVTLRDREQTLGEIEDGSDVLPAHFYSTRHKLIEGL